MTIDTDAVLDWGATALLVVLAVFGALLIFVAVPRALYANNACAEAGFNEATVQWNLKIYCTREENEYTVILPLSEARAR